eukprot:14297794-Alexandrium_andersonii.AAC.1
MRWLSGGSLPRHEFVAPLDILRMYARARRSAITAGHVVPELPFPLAARASLFNRTSGRDVDMALGVHDRRVEAARRYAARVTGADETTEAAEDGRGAE